MADKDMGQTHPELFQLGHLRHNQIGNQMETAFQGGQTDAFLVPGHG
jgi:hypothetical protein